MKSKYIILIIGLIMLVFLTGCTKTYYDAISQMDYDEELCGESAVHFQPEGHDLGLKIILKDKITGEIVEARKTLEFSGDILSNYAAPSINKVIVVEPTDNDYHCAWQTYSEKIIVSTQAEGYTPLVFEVTVPKNKLITIEVPMIRSCSGGPSHFDNIRTTLLARSINKTEIERNVLSARNHFSEYIRNVLALNAEDYELSCIEGDLGRGGYIHIKGIYNGSTFELYHRSGWCSSGGADCGWEACFESSSDTFFESVKKNICGTISDKIYVNNDPSCAFEAYDNTENVRNQCLDYAFEEIVGDEKRFTIIQSSGRCGSNVTKGDFNCMRS